MPTSYFLAIALASAPSTTLEQEHAVHVKPVVAGGLSSAVVLPALRRTTARDPIVVRGGALSKVEETVSLSPEEENALSRLVGSRLREVETSICYGLTAEVDFTKSEASDFCLVHAQDADGDFFLTIQNSLRDVRGIWDVPKPEVHTWNKRPTRPETMKIGHPVPGRPMDEVAYEDKKIEYKSFNYDDPVARVEVLQQVLSERDDDLLLDEFAIQIVLENGHRFLMSTDFSIMEWIKTANTDAGIALLLGKDQRWAAGEIRTRTIVRRD